MRKQPAAAKAAPAKAEESDTAVEVDEASSDDVVDLLSDEEVTAGLKKKTAADKEAAKKAERAQLAAGSQPGTAPAAVLPATASSTAAPPTAGPAAVCPSTFAWQQLNQQVQGQRSSSSWHDIHQYQSKQARWEASPGKGISGTSGPCTSKSRATSGPNRPELASGGRGKGE